MSTFIEFIEINNLNISSEEKDKLQAIEVMLTLNNTDIFVFENKLVIRNNAQHYIVAKNNHFEITTYERPYKLLHGKGKEETTKDDLISTIEHCAK